MKRFARTLLIALLALIALPVMGQVWEATRLGPQQWELLSDTGKHLSWHQSSEEANEYGQTWSLANGLRSFETRHTGTRWDATAFAQSLGINNSKPIGSEPDPNDPPIWTGTPDPQFTVGVPACYGFNQDTSDAENDPLVFGASAGCTLPGGVSYDAPNDCLDWTGSGSSGVTTSCVANVDDGVNPPVDSPAFSITISDAAPIIVIDPAVGDNGNTGADGDPWLNLVPVNAGGLPAGTVVQLKWNGFQTSANYLFYPTDSGTVSQWYTLENYPGFTPGLKGSSGGSHDLATLDGISYWRIKGISFGDRNDYDEAAEGNGNCGYSHRRTIYFTNGAHHLDIDGNEITGGCNYTANWVDESTSYIRVANNTGGFHGTNDHHPSGADDGDFFRVRGMNHIIFDSNQFELVGHSMLLMQANYAVVRDNDFRNDFTATGSNFTGGRAGESDATWSNKGAQAPFGPHMWRGNFMLGGGTNGDNPQQTITKFSAHRSTYKFNVLVQLPGTSSAPCIVIPILATDTSVSNQTGESSMLHNTCYDTDRFYEVNQTDGPFIDVYDEWQVLNNLMTGGYSGNDLVLWAGPNFGNEGYPTFWKGHWADGNSVSRADAGSPKVKLIDAGPTVTVVNFQSADATWLANFGPDNDTLVPTFVNPGAETFAGFALQSGSPTGIDDAVPISYTVGSYSGTSLVITRAWTFYDGWDMAVFGEDTKMDCVKIGSNPVVQFTYGGINEVTGAVTVDTSISGADNDPIYEADCVTGLVFNNRGANQVDP